MPLPHNVVGWSAVCDYGISWSYSLCFVVTIITVIAGDYVINCTLILSYDFASGSEITPCNKIVKPLLVFRLSGVVMTPITTLRT